MHSLQSKSQPKSARTHLPPVTFTPSVDLPPGPRHANDLQACSPAGTPVATLCLNSNWEHRTLPAAGIWEIWNAADNDQWSVSPRHLNAPGWYRTRITLRNPIPHGRTILHFQPAAHATTLWVGPILIGTRTPAEPCVFDITDALARLAPSAIRQGVPFAVHFEASEATSVVAPTLVYLPALALDQVQLRSRLAHDGSARLSIAASLYNPTDRSSACTASIEILDPAGHLLHSRTQTVDIWSGLRELASLRIVSGRPARCRITLNTPEGQTRLEQPIPHQATQPRHTLRAPSDLVIAHAPNNPALSWA